MNKAKYINAEAVKLKVAVETAENKVLRNDSGFHAFLDGFRTLFNEVIDEMQAADVQEVRYGEWKKKKSATGKGFYYFCTACYPHIDHFTTHEEEFDFVKAFKYCPYCGAKMRTKEEQT